MTDERAGQQKWRGIEAPTDDDIGAIATLFGEDMDALDIDVDRRGLERVAEAGVRGMRQQPRECLCWIARSEEEGDVVGVVLANFNWSVKFGGRALWIESLFVTPAARRHGIGRRLVERLLAWAKNNDIRGIDLEAYHGNTPASVLYRTLGFRRLGRERFYFRVEGSGYL